MKKDYFFPLIIILNLLISDFVLADGGMVVWPPEIHLEQSAQNAIVAWNEREEVIILSNDIKSDSQVLVLRIIPLPSSPNEIKEGNFDSFQKLVELMNTKLDIIRKEWGTLGKEEKAPAGGIEITFQTKIGPHDITVVEVNDLDSFLEWMRDFSNEKGLEVKEISLEFREGINNYLTRDIKYFVFDVIDTKGEKESIKPLIYRFESNLIYYPLKITAISEIGSSFGEITIFLITKEFIGEEFEYLYPVELTPEELQQVSEEIANLFQSRAKVIKVAYSGRLTNFNKDFILFPSGLWQRNLRLGDSGKDVMALQKILINEEFWGEQVSATGYFGTITQQALIKFQEEYDYYILRPLGLEKGTGYFGERSRSFFQKFSVEGEEKPTITQWKQDLYLGSRGEEVRALQEILIKEGVWPRTDVGATGFFGSITKEAVMKFQEQYTSEILEPLGLIKGTGFVGSSTRSFLEKISKE
jgi:peptidoglycan hydrolase-like protein with peptidoglycan-binding domain